MKKMRNLGTSKENSSGKKSEKKFGKRDYPKVPTGGDETIPCKSTLKTALKRKKTEPNQRKKTKNHHSGSQTSPIREKKTSKKNRQETPGKNLANS